MRCNGCILLILDIQYRFILFPITAHSLIPFVPAGISQFEPFPHLFQTYATSAFICLVLGVVTVGDFTTHPTGTFAEMNAYKAGFGG